MKGKLLSNLIRATIITAIGLVVAITSLHRLGDLLNFTQSMNGADFQMSDVYNNVADNRSVRTLSDEIVILPLDGYDRTGIAEIISCVNTLNPKAIGLDIMFVDEYEGDEYLIDVIENTPNIVLPLALDEETGSCAGSYFYDRISNEHFGVVNLNAYASNQSVRTYHPTYRCGESTINGFATEVAAIASSESSQNGTEVNQSEIIAYPSVEFQMVDVDSLMVSQENYRGLIANKIVLMGDIYNTGDYHLTPISSGMPGIMIHAHIVDTIISGKRIVTVSKWISWLIAFLLCYVLICIRLFVSDRSEDVGVLVIRILQIVFLYLFFTIGCKLFINQMLYIDFSPTLLMITISLFICDVWEGCVSLVKMIFKKEKI